MGQILNKQKQKQADGPTKNIEIKSKLEVIQDLKHLDQTKNLIDVFPKYEQVYKFLEKKEHRIYGEIFILAETNDPNIQIAVQESFFQNQFEFQMEVENLKEIESFTQQHQNLIQLIKYFDYNYNSMCTSFHRLITVTEYLSRDLSTELFFRKLLIEKTTSSATPKNGESTTKSNQMQVSLSSKSQRSLSANSVAVQNQSQVKNNSNMLHSKRLSEIQRKSVLIVTKVFSTHENDNIIEDQGEDEGNFYEKRGAIAKQIKNRSHFQFNASDNAYRFQEKEFTYILKSLISGLCYLQMQNRTHQCLRSSSIFIARDGTIKLTDPHLFNQSSLYTYIYKGQSVSGAYLSPLLVSNVEYSVVKPEHNEYKSDVFTLAVIMLEIAYLNKLDNYFDYTEYCLVDVEGLQILAENLKDIYSQSIISLLLQMLDENEDIRPDFVSLAQKLGIFNASTNAVVQLSKNDSQSVIYSKLASSTSSNQKPIPQATSIIIQPSDQSFTSQSPRFSKTNESNQQQSIQNATPKITQISDAKQKQNNFTQILNPYTQDTVRKSKELQITEKNSKLQNQANSRSLTPNREKTPNNVPLIPITNSSQDAQTSSPQIATKSEKHESICNDMLTPKRPQLAENLDNNYRFMTPLPQVRLQTPDNTTIQKHMHLLNQTPLTKTKQQPFFNKGVSPIKTESTASDIQRTLKTESSIDPQRYHARSTSPIMHHQSSPSKQPITPKSDFNKIISSQYTPTQVRMSINQSNHSSYPLNTSPFYQQSYSPISSYQTEKSPISTNNNNNNQNLSPISNYSTQQQNKIKETQNTLTNSKAQSRKNSNSNQIQSQNSYQPLSKQQSTVSPINTKQETKPTLSRQSLSAINIQQVGNLSNNRNSISDSSKAFNLVNSSRSPSPITSKSTQQIKKMINQSEEKPSSASIQIQQHIQNKKNEQKNSQQSLQLSNNQSTNSNNQIALKKLSISNPQSILPTKYQSQSSTVEKDIISFSRQPTFAPSQIGQQQKPPSLKSSLQQNKQSLQNLNVFTPQSQISNGVNVQAYLSSQSTVNRYSYGNIQIINQFDNKSPALTKLSNLSAANNLNGNNQTQHEPQSQKNYTGVAQKKGSVLRINQNVKSQKHGSLQINEQQTFGQQSIQSSVNNNSQTDSMTESSQQMKSSSRQSQKSHRQSQSGNQFQYRSKTEIGNEQDVITQDNQKFYDNFFKSDKSPVIQSNLQLLNLKQQQQKPQQETIYKPYIPKMCINTNNDQQAFSSQNFNNSKQQNGGKLIEGLGDLKPASELFSNNKNKDQPKSKAQIEESQQKSLKQSVSSNLSQSSANKIQKRNSNQIDINANEVSNKNIKNELTMSQINRELEKHRNFSKKLQEEMERQKQQQQILQQQIVNSSSKITEDQNNLIPTLEKQKSINTIIDQHIFDNQLRQTPSDIVFPFSNQNYSSTNDQPFKSYNHTGTFGKQPSSDNQNQEQIQNDILQNGQAEDKEEEEKPKKTSPPKEFGTDYIDQLIAKFKSEITSQIQTSNNQPNKQSSDAAEITQPNNTNLSKNTNSIIPSYTSYYATKTDLNNQPQSQNEYQNVSPSNINQNDQQNKTNLNIASNNNLTGEKYADQPASSERIMKRVESDSIGIGFAGFNAKAQIQLQKKGSLNNFQDEKIASNDFPVVGSRADLPKSPNSYIKQNFTEIHSIPLSQLQKAEALQGLDCQELKGQLSQQLKAKKRYSINEKYQNEKEKINLETQQDSSISSNVQEASSVYKGNSKQNYENMAGYKDSIEQISQNTSVSNNSQSIQIVLPKQTNLFGEKQQNQTQVNNGTDSYGNFVNNQILHTDKSGNDLQRALNEKKQEGDQNNIQMQIYKQNTFGTNAPALMDAIKKGNYVTEDLSQQYQSAQFNNFNSQNGINPPFISFAQISQQSNLNSIENIISTNYQSEIKFDHLNGYGDAQYKLANKFNQNIGEQLKSNNKQTYEEDRSETNNILIINNNDSQREDYVNNQFCHLQREAVIEYKTPKTKQSSEQVLTPTSDDAIKNFLDRVEKNNAYQIPNDFLSNYVQNNQININNTQNEQNMYAVISEGENINSKLLDIKTPLNTNQYFNNGNFSGGGSSSIYKLTITPPQKDQLETPPTNTNIQVYEFENENVAAFSDEHQFQYQNQQYYNNVMDGCQNISNIQKINEDETYNSKRSFDASADLLMMRSNQDIQEGIETSNFNYQANMMANPNFLNSPKKTNRNQVQSNNQNQNQYNIQQSDRNNNSKNNQINQQNYTSNSNLSPNKNYLFTPSPTRKDDSAQFNQTFSDIQMIQFLKNKENVIETYEDGSYYEGEKMNGVRHGRGKFFYGDGGSFQGEWQNGHMNGYGVLYYPSQNKAYEGEWDDDKFNGKGIMYNERPAEFVGTFNYHNMNEINDYWVKYEGDFKDDFKNGVGTLYLSNGERYIGRFKNDMVHGRGTFYKSDGSFITAEWSQNILLNYQ
ncbi:kinase domain protein (macronuclear) [Tetrahymena thermophila SB210]|uniref:MORN repeat-containing protein 3 n=1 Tax=Tetrahymena thermophila (strain SB210) TaxID=312017 RepID=I7LSV7_TETTS|nr:kinase domain protein [Tetrahymena thermophila SB210]EAR83331.2 kinase domain protein [Tetrahymena thermophila SB210]|eukprot:XP_001030994.2 kinase domain protein [Tetrahymena thermophila SB210]